jgi:hypothetical protein
VKFPACGELTQTKQSDMRLDEIEAVSRLPSVFGCRFADTPAPRANNENTRLPGFRPALKFKAGRNLT